MSTQSNNGLVVVCFFVSNMMLLCAIIVHLEEEDLFQPQIMIYISLNYANCPEYQGMV